MKVFVSWSGDASRATAEKISDWLRNLFSRRVEVFFSPDDIGMGERWAERVANVLSEYNFGIVVLNSANKDKPWVNFEAGALSKALSRSHLIPLLCGIKPGALLSSPLGQFQSVEADREGLLRLAKTINDGLLPPLTEIDLSEAFDAWWERKGRQILDFENSEDDSVTRSKALTFQDIMAKIDLLELSIREKIEILEVRIMAEAINRNVRTKQTSEVLNHLTGRSGTPMRNRSSGQKIHMGDFAVDRDVNVNALARLFEDSLKENDGGGSQEGGD